MKSLTILGSTGSIGVCTLDVIKQHPDRFQVIALTAHYNIELLFKQCVQHKPTYAVVARKQLADALQHRLQKQNLKTKVRWGTEALEEVVSLAEVTTVLSAIVGAAGLLPTLAAIKAKKQLLLANKEALVMAGPLVMEEANRSNILILPVDSEHNAILQCLQRDFIVGCGYAPPDIAKIILTASGGALRNKPLDQLKETTIHEACQHPNWKMGQKITIDSATLMNKGFEVIEAHFLFALNFEQIEVVLHPQSIVHSLVSYRDGSVLAQLASPDMRIPLSYVLAWPERLSNSAPYLDLLSIAQLDFKPIDEERYPCLRLAYQALKIGGTATTILNAANEIAVQAFLEGRIRFTEIAYFNQHVLEKLHSRPISSIEVVLEDDNLAREIALEMIQKNEGASLAATHRLDSEEHVVLL